jgi:hypothetical protein
MNKKVFLGIILPLVIGTIPVLLYSYFHKDKVEPTNNLQQEQINLDSIKAYTTKITDSLATIKVEYKAKIEAKNEVIRTLKGLVNDNNKKYQVITDSALVVELERLRINGIK